MSDAASIDDVDCQDLVEWTTEYFEGTLEPERVRRLEAHLTECDGCTEYVKQMRVMQGALGRIDAGALPLPGRERVLAAFRAWKKDEAGL